MEYSLRCQNTKKYSKKGGGQTERAANGKNWKNLSNKIMIVFDYNLQNKINTYQIRLINNLEINDEGTSLSYRRVPIINVKGMREIQNHQQANTIVITVADKIHQRLLKSVGESLRRNSVSALSQSISQLQKEEQ